VYAIFRTFKKGSSSDIFLLPAKTQKEDPMETSSKKIIQIDEDVTQSPGW